MKFKYLALFILFLQLNNRSKAQSISLNSDSFISIHAGSFINVSTVLQGDQTIKILDRYNTPGITAGLSYDHEKKHLTFSAGIGGRIIPFGFQTIVQRKDLEPTDFAFDFVIKNSQYDHILANIPLKIGYQTLANKSNQKFWVNTGISINFSGEKAESYSYGYTPTNSNQSLTFLSFKSNSQKRTFIAYDLGLGITQVKKNGNQIKFGLNLYANVSGIDFINAKYIVNLKDKSYTGSYHLPASAVGFNIAYSFKQHKNR
nr:hypothetical protein [Pseudopedobacter sp.]